MLKGVAGKFRVFAFDSTTGLPKTGDAGQITGFYSKDRGAVTAITDTSAAEESATNAPGFYLLDATAAETNADDINVTGKSSTSGIVVVGEQIRTIDLARWGVILEGTASACTTTAITLQAGQLAGANTLKMGVVKGTSAGNFSQPFNVYTNTAVDPIVATFADALGIAPTGTITYVIYGTPAASTTYPVPADATRFGGQTVDAAGPVTMPGTVASPTNITGGTIATVSGNVTGSVGSVAGAVGSVTGAVGSVTGNVGGNVIGTVASVTGAVGSVTGNVGGNVTGSVASVVGAVGSVTGFTAANIATIMAKTNSIPTDPADASDIAALIAAVSTLNSFQKAFLANNKITDVTATTGNFRVWPIGTAHVDDTGELAIIPLVRADADSPWTEATL